MLISAIVLSVVVPMQMQQGDLGHLRLNRPAVLGACTYIAQLIGLPRMRLRGTNGRPYIPNKAYLEEPLSVVHSESGQIFLQKQAGNERGKNSANWKQK